MAYDTEEAPKKEDAAAPLKSASWLTEVATAEKNLEKWHEQGRRIVKRFLDRRDEIQENTNKINLFASNTQILIATLYARFPKPMVTREFEDQDDDVARVASTIMERMLKIRPRDDFDTAMRNIVQDRLVPGCGTLWFRYEPEIEKAQTQEVRGPDGQVMVPAMEYEKVVNETVNVDYVFWEDLLWSPARTWNDVRWVGRKVKMTRADASKRFGEQIADKLNYSKGSLEGTKSSGENPDNDQVQYAEIYEVWCKKTKHVYWVSKGFDYFLDKKADPLKLKKFFPTPKFMMGMHSTSNYMPRPDYLMAQDQYEELDMVNNRITQLERAIKVVGVYDGTNQEIERIFAEGVDNKIIPTRSFSEFMEKGGMKGAIDWIPIEPIVNALTKLREYRQDLISQIYEVTGISDIMRGATKASETATAQQLKAQYGSVKLQFLQMEVASFVEEALEIKAQIIRNIFDPEIIFAQSNIQFTPDAQLAQQAIELIKSDNWDMRIEVHADTMAVPEFNAERDGRMEFIRSVSEMIVSAGPLMAQSPQAGVAMLQIMQWGAASFRTGNTIEGILDQAIAAIRKGAENPQPPPPNPEIEKAKLEQQTKIQLAQGEGQLKIQMAQGEAGLKQQQAQMDQQLAIQLAQIEKQTKIQIAQIQAEADAKIAQMKTEMEGELGSQQNQVAAVQAHNESQGTLAESVGEVIESVIKPIGEVVQAQAETASEIKEMMEALTDTMSRPRRKTPKRDAEGNIEYVDETVEGVGGASGNPKELQEALATMITLMAKPRRKIPKRDAEGNIIHVDEVIGD